MNFKKLTFLSFLIFSSFFSNSSNSSENFWALKMLGEKEGFEVFSVNSTTGAKTSHGIIQREAPNIGNVPGGVFFKTLLK